MSDLIAKGKVVLFSDEQQTLQTGQKRFYFPSPAMVS